MRKIGLALLFFLVFALYLFTLHPTVSPYRDSGDLIVASHTLGTAHPPGYPLYVLAGKAFSLALPWGNVAFRVNVMSAVFGAGTVFFMALLLSRLFPAARYAPALALLLAFSPAFCRLSQVSEMYSLNALFAAALLFIASLPRTQGPAKRGRNLPLFFLLSFICGLSMGNHPTIVFLFPALAWFMTGALGLKIYDLLEGLLFFALGWSVHAYLPVRAAAGPVSNWGDPSTLENFFRVITRADYGGLKLHPEQSTFQWTPSLVLQHLHLYGRSLVEQFTWPGLLAGLCGAVLTCRDRYFRFLLVSLLISGPAFVVFSNLPPGEKTTLPILEPHLVLPNVIFTVFIAAGLARLMVRVPGKAIALALLLLSFSAHFRPCDYRNDFYAYDYGRDLLATVGKDGIIFDPDDPTAFITAYLQQVEGKRRDLKLVSFFRTRWGYERLKKFYPEILPPYEIRSGQELAKTILDYNLARRPVYAELPGKFGQERLSYPRGLLHRLSAEGEYEPSNVPFFFYRRGAAPAPGGKADFFTRQIVSYYASAASNTGLAFARAGKPGQAKEEYLRALSVDPTLTAACNNLGTLAYAKGDYPEAEKWFLEVRRLDGENGSILYNLGLALKARGKLSEAEGFLSRAWRSYGSPDAGNELGLIVLRKGDARAASGIFRDVISNTPDFLLAYYNLGLSLKEAGEYAESRKFFTLYLQNTQDPGERRDVLTLLRALPER
ncbi:MAG: protein O-mannosyl-transferase family [Endomicrobiales bacterium]